jgi:hypothetical protein
MEAIARQPEAAGKIQGAALVMAGLALNLLWPRWRNWLAR